MPELIVTPGVRIPENAIAFAASRSPGPGGQNVNKVASKVELRVELGRIVGLDDAALERLRQLAGKRLLEGDVLLVTASESRNQIENRAIAERKLVKLVSQALVIPARRKATRPTRSSQERRVSTKKVRGRLKAERGTIRSDD